MAQGLLGAVFEGAGRGWGKIGGFVESAFGALGDEGGGGGGGALEDGWEGELVVGGSHFGGVGWRVNVEVEVEEFEGEVGVWL